jgi:hypothetical protein
MIIKMINKLKRAFINTSMNFKENTNKQIYGFKDDTNKQLNEIERQ